MKLNRMVAAVIALCLSGLCIRAEGGPAATGPAAAPASGADEKSATVNQAYPGLASGGLTYARLSNLPKGTVLKTGGLAIGEKQVADEIAKAPAALQAQLRKSAFFLLEKMATNKLLLVAARAGAAKAGRDVSKLDERQLFSEYFGKLTGQVQVTEAEIAEFYNGNKDAVGAARLEQVKPQIAQYLRQQKGQKIVAGHVETLGKRVAIEVSASWVKDQAALARDNPVGRARASGRPSLVDFGSKGCRPCDMLAPILETLRKKYEGKLNVLFISVREEQILTARYGVQTIPVQIFFDRNGREVFRHVGFYPQDEIEKKLSEMGVR